MSNPNSGWFKAMRSRDADELIRLNPNAYMLARFIAARARYQDGFTADGVAPGEAMLGDYKNYGMSERQYRTAKEQLQNHGFATFKTTNAGTIGKLTDIRLFDPLNISTDGQNDTQETDDRRTTDGRPTTNKKDKKERKLDRQSARAREVVNTVNKSNNPPEPTKRQKSTKLSKSQKECADRFEAALGKEWVNDAGKWVNRIKANPSKCVRIVAEVESAKKENRINTTPARYAHHLWKEFAG